jgi:hypothetical protein
VKENQAIDVNNDLRLPLEDGSSPGVQSQYCFAFSNLSRTTTSDFSHKKSPPIALFCVDPEGFLRAVRPRGLNVGDESVSKHDVFSSQPINHKWVNLPKSGLTGNG